MGLLPRRKTLGQRGEDVAVKHLKRQGYRILDRNARFGKYEIDIIAREGDTVAFVEVKTRKPSEIADPEDNITLRKQSHIRAAAHEYIAREDDPETYYRFDVVAVLMPEDARPIVTLYRNAFEDQ